MAYVGLIKGWERDPDRLWGQQVWVTPIDGGTPALVYQSPRAERLKGPTWSPDGKMLAFTVGTNADAECRGVVFVPLGTDGRAAGSPTRIELPDGTYSKLAGWSSDNQIAVMFSAPELDALYTVPISGGKSVQLTPKNAWMPSWTPDGKRIFSMGCMAMTNGPT
jgi:Tol biopolymer transport system component